MVLGSDCLEHAAHLVTVSSLKLVDKLLALQFAGHGRGWKYFSSLATFSITVRDSSKDFFQMWCQQHGDLSGVKHAKSLWPKCVAGRWNSCSDVERRMHDSGGQATVLPVMRRLMGDRREAAASAKELQSIDEIAVEETAHYAQQMGRWRATALRCVEDPLWWTVAEAMRMARSPALHLSVPCSLQHALCGCAAMHVQCLSRQTNTNPDGLPAGTDTHTHTDTTTHTHTLTHTHTRTRAHAHATPTLPTPTPAHMHTHMHMHTHTHDAHPHTHRLTDTHAHRPTDTHTHTRHTHTRTHHTTGT